VDIVACNGRDGRRVVGGVTNDIRVGIPLWPAGTSDYQTWREAVRTADGLRTDAIFGYGHFHKPFVAAPVDGPPHLLAEQPDVNNFEGVTLFTAEIHPTDSGYDFAELKDMLTWRDQQR
jgi:hypothetical protein